MKHGKKYQDSIKLIEKQKLYGGVKVGHLDGGDLPYLVLGQLGNLLGLYSFL